MDAAGGDGHGPEQGVCGLPRPLRAWIKGRNSQVTNIEWTSTEIQRRSQMLALRRAGWVRCCSLMRTRRTSAAASLRPVKQVCFSDLGSFQKMAADQQRPTRGPGPHVLVLTSSIPARDSDMSVRSPLIWHRRV